MKPSHKTLVTVAIAIALPIGWNVYWKIIKQRSERQIRSALSDYTASHNQNIQNNVTSTGIWKTQFGVNTSYIVLRDENSIISGYIFPDDPFYTNFSTVVSGYKTNDSLELQYTLLLKESGVSGGKEKQVSIMLQHNITAFQDNDILRGRDLVRGTTSVSIGAVYDEHVDPNPTENLFAALRVDRLPDALMSDPKVLEILKQRKLIDVGYFH